jgi:hypothetical protein
MSILSDVTETPTPNSHYVILQNVEHGARELKPWTSRDNLETILLGETGRLEYEIVGFTERLATAHKYLGIHPCCNVLF